jgi:hypothetical protein
MENGQVLTDDEVTTLVVLIKLGHEDLSYEEIQNCTIALR